MQTNEYDIDPKQFWQLFKNIFWNEKSENSDNTINPNDLKNSDSRNTI